MSSDAMNGTPPLPEVSGSEENFQNLITDSQESCMVLKIENTEQEEDDAEEDSAETVVIQKRKRGRPPKAKTPGEVKAPLNSSSEELITTPKKRGRPRKSEKVDSIVEVREQGETGFSPPRGRGRPRTDSSSGTQVLNKPESVQDVTFPEPFTIPLDSPVNSSFVDRDPSHSTPLIGSSFVMSVSESLPSGASVTEGKRPARVRKKPLKLIEMEDETMNTEKSRNGEGLRIVSVVRNSHFLDCSKGEWEKMQNAFQSDRTESGLSPRSGGFFEEQNEIPLVSSSQAADSLNAGHGSQSGEMKKRGRGRPRKDGSSSGTSATPRWTFEVLSTEDLDQSIEEGSSSLDVSQGTGAQVVKKRGRGRPKKDASLVLTSPAPRKTSEFSLPEDLDQSIEEGSSSLDVSQGTEPQVVKKRGRGRPKKDASLVLTSPAPRKTSEVLLPEDLDQSIEEGSSSLDVSQGSEPQVVKKRGRGRPKKDASLVLTSPAPRKTSEAVLTEDQQQKTGDGRGERKRKSIVSYKDMEGSDGDDFDGEEEVEKKPKVKKTPATKKKQRNGSASADGEEPLITACLRCGQKMNDLAAYKYHLMRQHSLVYWKDCPEGDESMKSLQLILKILKKITCPDCDKPFRFAQYYQHHRLWCGREEEKTKCELCGNMVKSMWMYQHNRDHKKREQLAKLKEEKMKEDLARKEAMLTEDGESKSKRKAAAESLKRIKEANETVDIELDGSPKKKKMRKDSDSNFEDKDDDEDDDDDDIDEENVDIGGKGSRSHKGSDGGNSSGRLIWFDPPPELDFFKEHQDFLDSNPTVPLLFTLLPSRCDWVPLSDSESSEFWPTAQESLPFQIEHFSDGKTEPATLKWGEAATHECRTTAFAGGIVNAVEWCPMGSDVSGKEQVLAVSAGRVMWDDWTLFEHGEGPGLIQFWSTPPLNSAQKDCCPDLKLMFTLAHNASHVLNMAWCPRGAFMDTPPQDEEKLQQLGLLAVAGYDSNAYVYSIPTPESLSELRKKKESQGNSTPVTYKPPPALKLLCRSKRAQACISVSWQKGGSCDYIAGGHSAGYVSLWHLSNTHPFVRTAPDTLVAVRCFYAHAGPVFSIDWSWQDINNIVTGGFDLMLKVWDSLSPKKPLMEFPEALNKQGGPVRAVVYGTPALDAILYADDQRDQYSGTLMGLDISEGYPRGPYAMQYHTTLDRHAAAIWDISYNSWFNVVASCDCTGMLSLSSCRPIHKKHKYLTRWRKGLPIFTTTCTVQKKVKDGDQLLVKKHKICDGMTWADAKGLQITFQDYNMKGSKNLSRTGEETSYSRQTFGDVQAADLMSTSFNPHKSSSTWLVTGSKAGFIRLLSLPCLLNTFKESERFFKQ